MLSFHVEGPFEIVPIHEPGGKLIEKTAVEKFWDDDGKAHLASAVGCYVFGFPRATGFCRSTLASQRRGSSTSASSTTSSPITTPRW